VFFSSFLYRFFTISLYRLGYRRRHKRPYASANENEDDVMTRVSDVGGDKYRRIWLKVIAQAYMDAVLQSRNPVKKTAAKRARAWITAGDADFKEVCALAGLDYKATQVKLIKALRQADAVRHATRSRAYGVPLRLTPPVCRLRARRTSQHYASAPSLQAKPETVHESVSLQSRLRS
jgi:hypothetical protein